MATPEPGLLLTTGGSGPIIGELDPVPEGYQ